MNIRYSYRRLFSSLSNRLLFYSLILIVAPLIVIGVFSYNTYSNHLEQATELYSIQILNKLKEQVDDTFMQLDDNLTALWIQNDLQKLIKLPPEKWKEYPSEIYSLSAYITNLFGWREGNKGVFVLTDLGAFYQEMTTTPIKHIDFKTYVESSKESFMNRDSWITGPHSQGTEGGEMVISINRPLQSIPDYKWRGVIRYDMSAGMIFRLFESTQLGTSGFFMATDHEGNIVYKPNDQSIISSDHFSLMNRIKEVPQGNFLTSINDVKYSVSIVSLTTADWKLIGIVPWSEIVEGADTVRRSVIIIGCLTLLAGALIVLRLNGILLKPLHQLNRAIRKLGGGDFSTQIQIPTIKELQTVAIQYNQTSKQLKTLTEELFLSKLNQQEAELHAQSAIMKHQETELRRKEIELRMREAEYSQLQAQINPHFLYNTLSCIDSLAEVEQAPQVRKAVGKLSHMFRYSISPSGSMVKLEEEIGHVKSYVTLQHFRYEERIRVEFNIPDEVKAALIHRLTIQPLVENAYFHGLETCIAGGLIRVSAQVHEQTLQLKVEDDGVGLDDKALLELNEFMNSKGTIDTDERLGGLRNVIRRLYLAYGDECFIQIQQLKPQGTSIRIELPFRTQ